MTLTPLHWTVGHTADPAVTPTRFVPATVPGAVQLDWARAEGWPAYWIAENFRAYGWMEDVHWVYRARLSKPALQPGTRLVLACRGVDYACSVRLDGRTLLSHEGMFSPIEADLTDARDGAEIEIVVAPAPKLALPDDEPGDILDRARKQSRQSCKPAVAYGWDFHPRLIPLGIWDEIGLEVRSASAWLDHVEVEYDLAADFGAAELRLLTEGPCAAVRWTVHSPADVVVGACEGAPGGLSLRIAQPELWWPLSEGKQSLYTSTVETLDAAGAVTQTTIQRVGLRSLRLVMAPGQFNRAGGCPATQPPVPITFEVNGRPIFARGANWVSPDIFPGTLTTERYRAQLSLFAGANLNFLRANGVSTIGKQAFFDTCDELGILVWQEFPLACNRYDGTPAYLKILDQESRAIIRRLRRHACLAIWCGGNELLNSWSGMTMQDHALRLTDRNCFELDPRRPYLPTSPLTGIFHGDYRFKMGPGTDAPTVFDLYPRYQATAYMEFGVPSPPSAARLREVIPADEIWPVGPTKSWKAHNAFGAWHSGEPGSWLYPEVAEHYFGPAASLEQMVERLQLLQAEGYKAIYEEGRRQKPVCSAVACWVFNESWPCAANNSLVAWPCEPKPGYFAVAAANRPTMASARILRFDWKPGEEFAAELFLLHDGPAPLPACTVRVFLETASGRTELASWACPGAPANAHAAGPKVRGKVPQNQGQTFDVVLEVAGQPALGSRYTLAFKR